MKKTYIDETYTNNYTMLISVDISDEHKLLIYKKIKLVIKNKLLGKIKQVNLTEFKGSKLKNFSFWSKIEEILIEHINHVYIHIVPVLPSDREGFVDLYSKLINNIYIDQNIIADRINNKKFMAHINKKLANVPSFSFSDSLNEKGIQIADLLLTVVKGKVNTKNAYKKLKIFKCMLNTFELVEIEF